MKVMFAIVDLNLIKDVMIKNFGIFNIYVELTPSPSQKRQNISKPKIEETATTFSMQSISNKKFIPPTFKILFYSHENANV